MRNEPAPDEQADGEQDGHDGQPVSAAPPEREQEAHADDDAGHLARDDVEAAEDEQGADERRAKVAGRQRHGVLAALHVRDAALAGVERNALDVATRQDAGDGMAELVEGDDEHLAAVHGLAR